MWPSLASSLRGGCPPWTPSTSRLVIQLQLLLGLAVQHLVVSGIPGLCPVTRSTRSPLRQPEMSPADISKSPLGSGEDGPCLRALAWSCASPGKSLGLSELDSAFVHGAGGGAEQMAPDKTHFRRSYLVRAVAVAPALQSKRWELPGPVPNSSDPHLVPRPHRGLGLRKGYGQRGGLRDCRLAMGETKLNMLCNSKHCCSWEKKFSQLSPSSSFVQTLVACKYL